MGGSTTDKRDIYYRLSKTEGYRARSAYKLLQLDEIFGLFHADSHALEDRWDFPEDGTLPTRNTKPTKIHVDPSKAPTRVVDLCAAPGSWSQVLVQKLPKGSRIVAVDLQPMAPVPGVIQVLGDITTQATADEVVKALRSDQAGETEDYEKGLAQLIVCDGAPDVTGVHDLDEFLHAQLMLAATQITFRLLEVGGTFIAKIFTQHTPGNTSGAHESGHLLRLQFEPWFEHVDIIKPRSSRTTSVEHFVVCRNFRPPFDKGFDRRETPAMLKFAGLQGAGAAMDKLPKELRQMVGITACGDLSGWDK
jgi:tRNA (cytidine32/guanosine34-2'-O)-methyltransferase